MAIMGFSFSLSDIDMYGLKFIFGNIRNQLLDLSLE